MRILGENLSGLTPSILQIEKYAPVTVNQPTNQPKQFLGFMQSLRALAIIRCV